MSDHLVTSYPKAPREFLRATGGKKLAQFSKKRKSARNERAAVVAACLARDGGCVAESLIPHVACGGPLDCHEIIPRSAWAAGYLVLANTKAVCRAHHGFIDANPEAAWKLGLHGFSWQRPDRQVGE